VRVQIPEVLNAGNLFSQPSEDVGLKVMVISAAARRVFRVSAGRGQMAYLKALLPLRAEERYGKFQPFEFESEVRYLGIDAILQNKGLIHWSKSFRN
jgi:hypothetical protein